MPFNIGENVGPYRIMEQLGQGGMATVYKAYHASLDRYVALKVLHPAFHQDQTFTLRFQREARVVARLEHQNIVPIYDYAEHEGRPYLVMKYIEGDTLKARLNKGPLTSQEIEQVVNSVGYALAYAHRQGILHRDVKPSNVMIAKDGTMYLADFGLARIAEAGESTLSSDAIMGTPQYISPEQAMGKKDLDAGTDIYSFGVMLYELVVGRVPFTSDTPFSIIHDHIYTPLPLPRNVNPNVPEAVERALLKALAKDRADRYASIEDFIKAFKDAWTEAGVPMQGTAIIMRTAAQDSPRQASEKATKILPEEQPKAQPAKQKMSKWIWAGIGLMILLLCAAGLALLNRRNARLSTTGETFSPRAGQTLQPEAPPPAEPMNPIPPGGMQPNPNDPPELQAAKQAVAQNPKDPQAHLQLSLVWWDMKEPQNAFNEALKAANFADPTLADFFVGAAREYRQREAWALAMTMYSRVIPIYRQKGIPEDLLTEMREAAYKSAEQLNLFDDKAFTRLDESRLPLAVIMRGRRAMLDGDLEKAKALLDEARKIRPDLPEYTLFKAEILLKEQNPQQARELLNELVSQPATPDWIRQMAEELLNSIQ